MNWTGIARVSAAALMVFLAAWTDHGLAQTDGSAGGGHGAGENAEAQATSGKPEWTVRIPAGEISLRPGQSVPIGVTVGSKEVKGVALHFATLVEVETKRLAGLGWELCRERNADSCKSPLDLDANSVQQLFLRPAGGMPLVGTFTGDVVIAAAGGLVSTPGTVTLHGTTNPHRVGGGFLIFFSVCLAFVVTTVMQHLRARAQLLESAEILRRRIASIHVRLGQAPEFIRDNAPETKKLLNKIDTILSSDELVRQGLVPSRLPMPWPAAFDPAPLETLLSTCAAWAGAADLLVKDGFETLVELAKNGGVPEEKRIKAVKDLDDLAKSALPAGDGLRPAPDAGTFAAKVAETVASVSALPGVQNAHAVLRAGRQLNRIDELRLEIRMASVATWFVYLLLTSALGVYLLIYRDPGFGTLGDFLQCIFWGFGLPIGATLLQQTPANVSSVLRIPVPKPA